MKIEDGKYLLTIYTFLTFMEAAMESCSKIKTVPESFKSFKNIQNFRR